MKKRQLQCYPRSLFETFVYIHLIAEGKNLHITWNHSVMLSQYFSRSRHINRASVKTIPYTIYIPVYTYLYSARKYIYNMTKSLWSTAYWWYYPPMKHFRNCSVSSRIQKGHGATDHWGHLIMPAGHPVDFVGHYQHPPSPIRVQTESDVNNASYYHTCTQAAIRYCVIVNVLWTRDISYRGVFHCDNGLGGLNMP